MTPSSLSSKRISRITLQPQNGNDIHGKSYHERDPAPSPIVASRTSQGMSLGKEGDWVTNYSGSYACFHARDLSVQPRRRDRISSVARDRFGLSVSGDHYSLCVRVDGVGSHRACHRGEKTAHTRLQRTFKRRITSKSLKIPSTEAKP